MRSKLTMKRSEARLDNATFAKAMKVKAQRSESTWIHVFKLTISPTYLEIFLKTQEGSTIQDLELFQQRCFKVWSHCTDSRCQNTFCATSTVSKYNLDIPHICHGRHGRRPCKFFLAGVNFFRCNAKNWQFTV